MTKSDFHSEFEDNRQTIEMDEKAPEELPSRVEVHKSRKHAKKPKKEKRRGLTLINTILILFTLIPIGIFVYVLSDLYNPKEADTVSIEKQGVTYELDSKQPDGEAGLPVDGDGEEEKDEPAGLQEDTGSKEQSSSKAEPQSPPVKQEPKPEQKPQQKPEQKPQAQPQQKPEQKPQAQPQQKPEKKPQTQPQQKPEQKPQTQPSGKTHTVGPNETLYRISVNYYGSGDYVEKIKAANGLTSNSISAGQTLVLP